jgi:hypothetical protein
MNLPIIRTSERAAIKRCPWAWWQRWRRGLVPIGTISDALWFGTGVHIALARWYCGPGLKRGPHPAETFADWAAGEIRYIKTSNQLGSGALSYVEEKLVPAWILGEALLTAYVADYGEDEHMWVIEPEHSGQVDIRDPDYPDEMLAIYAFTYDLVWRNLITNMIWLEEHKTAKAVRTDYLPLDDQAGSYWAVAEPHLRAEGLIGKRERLAGIEYNFLRKAMPDARPRNADGYCTNKPIKTDYIQALQADGVTDLAALEKLKVEELAEISRSRLLTVFGEVSKMQPKPLFVREEVRRTAAERATQIRRIQGDALLMAAYRDKTLPLGKTSTRDCPFCDYFDMCLLDEAGADAEEYQRAMYRVEDPYADHRKSTEEA